MEAVPGDSLAPPAEHGVGLGGTVTGNNMVLRSIAQFVCESIEEVQQVPVDGLYFSGVVIPKNIIDFVQGFRMIVAVGIITDVQGFMGMRVIEMEHATRCRRPIGGTEGEGGEKAPDGGLGPDFQELSTITVHVSADAHFPKE